MTATVAGIHLGLDTHANRPAANTVPDGALYSCSDHGLVYKSNYAGNSWATWRASTAVTEILDIPTTETDDTLVLAPDGAGGVEFRAEAGGGGGGGASPFYLDTTTLDATYGDEFDGTSLDAKWTRYGIDTDIEGFAVGGTWMQTPMAGTSPGARGYYQTPVSMPTYMELIWSGSYSVGWGQDNAAGPLMVTSGGAGVAAAIRSSDDFAIVTLASSVLSGQQAFTDYASSIALTGVKHWLRLIRMVCDGATLFTAQFSLDGNNWSDTNARVDSTAVTRIGFGRIVANIGTRQSLQTDRFNAVALTLGTNLVRTPTSGTATYTSTSNFGGFAPSAAADGNHGTEFALAGAAGANDHWTCTWSVAQSINTIMLRGRTSGGAWGHGYIEFSDGSRVPHGYMEAGISGSNNVVIIRLPANKSTTLLKVVTTSAGGSTPGFTEVEAYNAT